MERFIKAAVYLPSRLSQAVYALAKRGMGRNVCEIRLRENMPLAFSTYNGCVFVNENMETCKMENAIITAPRDIIYTVNCLCSGSVYRYGDTLKKGYIVTPDGIRAGICGHALYENGVLSVVDNYTGINIRIPRRIEGCAAPVMRNIALEGLNSMLIFSSPGVGKTTLIREMAIQLSRKYGVAVVDEKGEILPACFAGDCGMCDILTGYSKPEGMELAVRMMSPQVIICDEIGMADDISAILSVQNSGVPLIATVHCGTRESLFSKPNIKRLCECGVFSRFVRLERGKDGMEIFIEKD
ncbi:MAG: hypothetical protein E7588_05610 [Ruminococcaceae bacterium]|nr:hypothetical protein [Oscillospiraceae bacterium]